MRCGSTELLKIAVASLGAALLTGASAWLTFGRDAVSTEELKTLSPWTAEKGEVVAGIKENTRNIARLEAITQKIVDTQQKMAVSQQDLITKIEALIRQRR